MKSLAFVLLVLVGSLILTNLPIPSYADPNLDTLLRIATQARDNINIQLSQLPTVPNEINQLYQQGSQETDALTQSVSQNDQTSAREHFLSAMKIFKEINDRISSLTSTTTSEQPPQIDTVQLKSEINRIQKLGDRLEAIATKNNVEIDFTKFNETMQTAIQNLNASNSDQVNKDLETANQFLLNVHQLLADAAKKKTTERAKDFTEKQIQRLSQIEQFSPPENVTQSSPNPPENVTQSSPNPPENVTQSSPNPPENVTQSSPNPPENVTQSSPNPPENVTQSSPNPPENVTQSSPNPPENVTQSPTPPSTPLPAITNTNQMEKIPDMINKLKQLVSEGKIDEALKLIKLIEALQNQHTNSQISTNETSNQTQSETENSVNSTQNDNTVNNIPHFDNEKKSHENKDNKTQLENNVNATINAHTDNNLHHDFHKKNSHNDGTNSENKNLKGIRTDNSEN